MDDEIEDLVGDVKLTDSQKSVTTSNVYSYDFTDSSPDGNNSTGQETYVIDREDSDISEMTFQMQENMSPHKQNYKNSTIVKQNEQNNPLQTLDQSVCTNSPKISIIAQETFTQTSKTIIELVQSDPKKVECRPLETQTSFVSITENGTLEYRIHFDANTDKNNGYNVNNKHEIITNHNPSIESHRILANSLEDKSSVYRESDENVTRNSSNDTIIRFIDDESKENIVESKNETKYENNSVYQSSFDSDIEDDSLMGSEYRDYKIYRDDVSDASEADLIDRDVEELYNKLSESPVLLMPMNASEADNRNFSILTPLTEETSQKKENIIDVTPSESTLTDKQDTIQDDTIFINNCGVRIKMLNDNKRITEDNNAFKLPPIQKNQSCPNSPHLNFLFSVNTSYKPVEKVDRWEISRRDLASGESPLISGRSDPTKLTNNCIQLPPIHVEGNNKTDCKKDSTIKFERYSKDYDAISIKGKIGELKMCSNHFRQRIRSTSLSPTSSSSPGESKLSDIAEKACGTLCVELLRRLRSPSWIEVTETLDSLPKALDTFWPVISENSIATFLRQVIAHIESPRTQVAKTACSTLAEILRNTNYTKKPDFYEAIATLLTKTGSFSRPVRRAANVALDDIVCSVDITQAVTAICIYGVGHKSPLVRCASARLLVVCCALAGGGRRVLRERPPTAAAARRHALRSLAELLYDKNTDTRKYAERLYQMLRPLPNFEAYFLTDVDVELASQHLKKYDQLLCNKLTR